MPDPLQILLALAAAAAIAAAVSLLAGWPWRKPSPARSAVGRVLGAGLGFIVGCWWLGVMPHLPPREDLDRLLLILFPALVVVELLGAFPWRYRWLVWVPRLVVAAAAAPILLHNSVYLADLAGPDSRERTPIQAGLILVGLAAALAGVWALLALLVKRTPGRSVPLAVALTCAGASVAVMLSGYASGGQLGLPLAAAVVGAVVASLALSGPLDVNGVLGLGVVGLFALLVIGRFFGELPTEY